MRSLTPRHRRVLELRETIDPTTGRPITFRAIGAELGVTASRARELHVMAERITKRTERPTCGYCRDCRWWESWEHAQRGFCDNSREPGSTFYGYDPDGRGIGRVVTKAEHGCIQWQAREP